MKRFYCTRTPETSKTPGFLKETLIDAIKDATAQVERNEGTVYIVQVILKVERSPAPITVTEVA